MNSLEISNAKNSKESWQSNNEFLNKKRKTTEVKELDINGQLITGDDSAVAKFFEKLVYRQLSSFLRLNGILEQSGFRHQHSTETAQLRFTNEWLFNMDRGLLGGALFLYLKKAFYTVDHHILLSKLELCVIKGTSLKWFECIPFWSKPNMLCQ